MDLGPHSTRCTGYAEESHHKHTHAPYYNIREEVVIHRNASLSGLGAALMQERSTSSICITALTVAETQYAHMEEELLAIVSACDPLEAYIYGRDNDLWEK